MGNTALPRNRLALVGFVTLLGCIAVVAATQVRAQTMPRATGNGAFYVKCPFSHRAADDAIVFPGEPGRSHLHDFLANKSTNAFSTNESLRAATTTCKRPADRSAYWIPTLYLDSAPIAPIEATANYNGGIRDVASIQPFPEGFRMIAGDSKATERQVGGHVVDWTCEPHKMVAEGKSPQGSPRAQAFRAVIAKLDRLIARKRLKVSKLRRAIKHRRIALKRQRARGGSTLSGRRVLVRRIRAYRKQRRALRRARFERANRVAALDAYLNGGGTSIPTCAKGTPLVLDVRFGDCWDGAHLDSADHKSHVAYSRYSKADNKWVCPSTHPVLLPKLRLRVEYPITGGPDVRLSPGDVDAGHADFMNGWDQGKLAELVRTCLNADKNCGNGDVPMNDGTPSPAPVPSPAPTPSPSPSPQPEPEPDPNPLPPLPPLP